MEERLKIVKGFYEEVSEDDRLERSRHGQLEYATTMEYIHRYVKPGAKIIELGAGTGRYSIALAKEGYDVTAVELVEKNLQELRRNAEKLPTETARIQAFQGDATDLSRFADGTFDVTLSLGPMYHLYDAGEIRKAIREAIRVTRKGGVIIVAFLSVYAILFDNYLKETLHDGMEENFDEKYRTRHYAEQLFTGYDVTEFEQLFKDKPVDYITTVGTNGILESIEERKDFELSDADFEAFADWYLMFAEKRELLGTTCHLLYLCRKI